MFPITVVIMTIVFNFMRSNPKGGQLTEQIFKGRVFTYMIIKTTFAALCAVLVKFVIPQSIPNNAQRLHDESRTLGLLTQLKLLLTDSTYVLFVYGPLISVSLIGGSDNHLDTMLSPFSFTQVRLS
jgi:Na+/serine symporter